MIVSLTILRIEHEIYLLLMCSVVLFLKVFDWLARERLEHVRTTNAVCYDCSSLIVSIQSSNKLNLHRERVRWHTCYP